MSWLQYKRHSWELRIPMHCWKLRIELQPKALDEFRGLPCKQGRARIYGKKTIGIDDPGMVVVRKLVEGLKEARGYNSYWVSLCDFI